MKTSKTIFILLTVLAFSCCKPSKNTSENQPDSIAHTVSGTDSVSVKTAAADSIAIQNSLADLFHQWEKPA